MLIKTLSREIKGQFSENINTRHMKPLLRIYKRISFFEFTEAPIILPNNMPELWDLLVHYDILVSIVRNLTTRDFFHMASTDLHSRKFLITDRDDDFLRNIKSHTRCEGEGCRKRHGTWGFDVLTGEASAQEPANGQPFPLLGCADSFDFCARCGCKTCEVSLLEILH